MKTIELTCQNCKKSFIRPSYRKNIFCSYSCAATHRNKQRGPEWYKKHSSYEHLKLIASNRKDEFSPFKYYITKCKERYKQKQKIFDVDVQYLKIIWENQKGICPYTGLKMILPETTLQHSSIRSLKKASLDRIDSSKGYVKDNVEFVCLLVNLAKNSFQKSEVESIFSEIKMSQIPYHV